MSWVWVGVGAAVGATAGAISGSRTGGDDVWKQALGGAALGGAAGGAGYAAFGAEAAAPAVVAETAAPEVVATGGTGILAAPATATTTTAPAASGIMTVEAPNAAAGLQSLESGVVNPSVMTPGIEAPQGAFGTSFNTANTGNALVPPSGMVQPPAPPVKEYAMWGGDEATNVAANTPKTPTQSSLEKGFESAKSWLSEPKNAMLTGVLGLGALSMFNNQNNETFGGQPVTQAGYSLSPDFKPIRVNPQQYRYRSSYAEGGLTDLDVGMRGMYARQAAEPVTMMASGGIASYARGGDTRRQLAMIDPRTQEAPAAPAPSYVGSAGIYYDEDVDTKYQDALTAAQTRMAKAASRANVQLGAMQKPTPLGKLNLGPVVKEKQQAAAEQQAADYDDGLAGGGIASLGGYAAGGNPHLLRGPGDGMSDDIPASIADKQPARLADGEFVVPADVVSGLGNGSTEAGAKKLHKMMDKVRVARTGTKKQGKEIKAEKYIPGMAEGGRVEKGIAHFDGGGGAWTDPYLVPTSQGGFLNTGTGGLSAAEVQAMIDASKETKNATDEPSWKLADPGQFAVGGQETPNYAVPGYTLSNNLGRWSNVAGDAQRAMRPASINQQVTQAYLNNLGRAPDQQGFNYWMQSPGTGAEIERAIATSPEAQRLVQPTINGTPVNEQAYINNLYKQYLNRAPDTEGLTFWQKQLGQNATQDQVQQAIMGSPEAQQYEKDYITQLYAQHLGRNPDQEGLQFWQQQMLGTTNQQDILNAIKNSPEAQAYQQATQAAIAQSQAARAPAAAPAAEAAPAASKRRGGILAAKK